MESFKDWRLSDVRATSHRHHHITSRLRHRRITQGSLMADRKDLRTGEWKRTRAYILERDAYTCAYCAGEADTVDHILPNALGGTSDPGNLIACCRRCNSSKADRINKRLNWANSRWGVVVP